MVVVGALVSRSRCKEVGMREAGVTAGVPALASQAPGLAQSFMKQPGGRRVGVFAVFARNADCFAGFRGPL